MVFESEKKEKRRRKKSKLKLRVEIENKIYILEVSGWKRYLLLVPVIFMFISTFNWLISIPKLKELKELQNMIKNGSDGENIILKVEEIMNKIEELELSKDRILATLGESKDKLASYDNLIFYNSSNERNGGLTKNGDNENKNTGNKDVGENKIFLSNLAIAGIDPEYNSRNIVSAKHTILNKLEKITEDISSIHEKLKERNKTFEYFPTLLPVKGYITSRFGTRLHPIEGEEKFHTGVDIAAPYGSPVYATASGKVIRARKTNSGKGNYVMIKHINNLITVYLHLSRISVKEGQFVKKGEIIGYIGASGLATGPHLHYEVLFNGKPIDPLIFMLED